MERKLFVLVLTVCLLVSVGCQKADRNNHATATISQDTSYITALFLYQDTLYTMRQSGSRVFLVAEEDAEAQPEFAGTMITEVESDYGSLPFWDEKTGTICYASGSSLYQYDMKTQEDTLLWSLPEATKKDHIAVIQYSDDWFVIQAFRGQKNTGHDCAINPYLMKSMEYMAVNRQTGETVPLCYVTPEDVTVSGWGGTSFTRNYIADNGYYGLVSPLCMDGNEFYYLQHKTKADAEQTLAVVLCTDLLTGETTELAAFEQKDIYHAEGCRIGEYLYFTTDHFGIWALDLSERAFEYRLVAMEEEGHRYHLPHRLLSEADHLYLILWDDNDVSYGPIMGALCEWDPETNTVTPVSDSDYVLDGADNVCFYGEIYYLFSGTNMISGEF